MMPAPEPVLWRILDETAALADGDTERYLGLLRARLSSLPERGVALFEDQLAQAVDALDCWELWGATYLLLGGCNASAFEELRSWVVSRGSDVYARVRVDPDALADVPFDEEDLEFAAEFRELAVSVSAQRTGLRAAGWPGRRSGMPRGERLEMSEEALRARLPRLAARVIGDVDRSPGGAVALRSPIRGGGPVRT